MSIKWDKVLTEVIEVVKEVGAFQMKHFRSMPAGSDDSKAVREMVSFVDVESEKMLKAVLDDLVPDAGFFGEETGKQGNQEYTWIVDPLDGTTNFLSGLDQFAVSVAFVEKGETILGAIYKPASKDMYSAIKGGGYHHNGQKLAQVSTSVTHKEALYVTGFPYRSPDVFDAFFKCAGDVLLAGRGLRRFGCAALDLCMVAAGWQQGYWESDLQPYDIAAGVLFLKEGGCKVTNELGEEYNLFTDRMMVAALPAVYDELLRIVYEKYGTMPKQV
jgi:myo-inositol-1(or 4)-monophosphatase